MSATDTNQFQPPINQRSTLVLVPAYNAAGHLPELITRLRQFVCGEHLLVVNDGSTDDSAAILTALKVNHIPFRANRGKGAALVAGFRYAMAHGYRSVLTIDADLQHLPEEIPGFYALDNGRRLIIGTRTIDGGLNLSRCHEPEITDAEDFLAKRTTSTPWDITIIGGVEIESGPA